MTTHALRGCDSTGDTVTDGSSSTELECSIGGGVFVTVSSRGGEGTTGVAASPLESSSTNEPSSGTSVGALAGRVYFGTMTYFTAANTGQNQTHTVTHTVTHTGTFTQAHGRHVNIHPLQSPELHFHAITVRVHNPHDS